MSPAPEPITLLEFVDDPDAFLKCGGPLRRKASAPSLSNPGPCTNPLRCTCSKSLPENMKARRSVVTCLEGNVPHVAQDRCVVTAACAGQNPTYQTQTRSPAEDNQILLQTQVSLSRCASSPTLVFDVDKACPCPFTCTCSRSFSNQLKGARWKKMKKFTNTKYHKPGCQAQTDSGCVAPSIAPSTDDSNKSPACYPCAPPMPVSSIPGLSGYRNDVACRGALRNASSSVTQILAALRGPGMDGASLIHPAHEARLSLLLYLLQLSDLTPAPYLPPGQEGSIYEHSLRLAKALLDESCFPAEWRHDVVVAAIFHDVGVQCCDWVDAAAPGEQPLTSRAYHGPLVDDLLKGVLKEEVRLALSDHAVPIEKMENPSIAQTLRERFEFLDKELGAPPNDGSECPALEDFIDDLRYVFSRKLDH